MPNKSLFLSLLALLCLELSAQAPPCKLQAQYEKLFWVGSIPNDKGKPFLQVKLKPQEGLCLPWLGEQSRAIDFLYTNFSDRSWRSGLVDLGDSAAIASAFFEGLRGDTAFNALMQGWEARLNGQVAKDSLNSKQVLNIAVKFFSIEKINAEGHYVGRVCVGLNDIKATESLRFPYLEAFCFGAIIKHFQSPDYNMHGAFVESLREVYELNLGIDPKERLLRAQGALYMLMKRHPKLEAMLKAEYKAQAEYLPFIWTF